MRNQPSGSNTSRPLAAVVALHQEGPAEPQLAGLADAAGRPVSGSTTCASKPGRRPAERAPLVLGQVRLVVRRRRHTLPASVMPEHRVAQLRVGRRDVARQDRPEVARAGSTRGPTRERRVGGKVGDGLGEAVDHRRPLALEHVEDAGRGRGVRADEPRPGDQGAEQRVGEPADPEERRVREQHLVGVVPPELVEVVEVADQRAVGVDHSLRLAGRARGVDDDHAVRRRDIRLRRREHVGVDRPSAESSSDATVHPGWTRRVVGRERDLAQRRHRRRQQRRRRGRGRARRWRAQRGGVVVRAVRGRAQEELDVGVAQQPAQLGRRRERAERNASPHRCGPRPARTRRSRPPFGCSSPTCVPLPAPTAIRARASRPTGSRRRA